MALHVNTAVVSALMQLKGVSSTDLTRVTGVPHSQVRLWLAGLGEPDVLPQSLQLVLLAALGVTKDTLRGDMVHSWSIREPLLGSARKAWAPLETIIAAFGGEAKASYVTQEEDPYFSLRPVTVYLLKFRGFTAVLRVHGNLLRPVRFDPALVKGLSWASGNIGILLADHEFERVANGEIGAKPLNRLLLSATEPARWEQLIELARANAVTPEALSKMLLGNKQGGRPLAADEAGPHSPSLTIPHPPGPEPIGDALNAV